MASPATSSDDPARTDVTRRWWERTLAPLGFGVLAFVLRALSFRTVFEAGRVYFPEPDAWYHLRRIAWALRNAPDTLGFDPYLAFPHGARAIWPPLFDTVIARGLAPFVDAEHFEPVVAWLPPVLGAASVVVLYRVMRRHFGPGVAALSAGILCVLPAAGWYARVGAVDHHVAVALLATVLLGATLDLVKAFRCGRPVAWRVVWLGVVQGLLLLLWPGGLLHVALLEAGLAGFWLLGVGRRPGSQAARFARLLAVVQVVSVAVLLAGGAGAVAGANPWTPTLLSRFQPGVLALGAVVALASAALAAGPLRGRGPGTRAAAGVAVAAVLAAAALLLLPGLRQGVVEALAWLARDERFQGSVVESRPLFFATGVFDPAVAVRRLSRFVLLLPVALGVLAARERRAASRPELFLLAGYTLGLVGATLDQARFANSLAAPLAGCFGLSMVALHEAVARRLPGRLGGWIARLATAGLVVWLCMPVASAYRLDVRNQLAALRGEPLVLPAGDRYWRALYETALWMRDHTPSPGDAWDPGVRPTWGVMGHWQYGHLVRYVAQRPAVVGNFGDDLHTGNYPLSFEYFRGPEETGVRLLDALRARYVLIRPIDVAGGDLGGGTMIDLLADPDGGDSCCHRLVYERRVLRDASERPRSHFRVFERVAGARVVGRAPAGSTVEARLPYASPTGRKGQMRRRVRADAAGRYELRLPYATRGGPPGMVVAGAWQIGPEGKPADAQIVVPESAVRLGSRLAGPDLVASHGPPQGAPASGPGARIATPKRVSGSRGGSPS